MSRKYMGKAAPTFSLYTLKEIAKYITRHQGNPAYLYKCMPKHRRSGHVIGELKMVAVHYILNEPLNLHMFFDDERETILAFIAEAEMGVF